MIMKKICWLILILLFSGFSLVNAQTTYYTLASGDWDNPDIWTLDPAGAILVNPDSKYPEASTDNVVIKTGKVITIPVADVANGEVQVVLNIGTVTIDGSLKIGTTTGHTFDKLRGSGRIFLQGDNFPTVTTDVSHFITEGKGEGTVVLEGDSFTFGSSVSTLFDLEVYMNSGQTVTLTNNLSLNGGLLVVQGTLQINDGSNTTSLTIDINGNVLVQSTGAMTVGGANAFHWLVAHGDFKNYGTVSFSNSSQYSEATDGAVKLKFTGTTDNNMVCEGPTNLYRLFLDKGVDRTFVLNMSATDATYLKMYGPLSGTTTDGADGAAGWERLPIVLTHGTLKLGSNISLSSMGENRDGTAPNEFTIPVDAGLWINGANVTTSANATAASAGHGLTLYGLLRISSGTLTLPSESLGITYETDVTNRASLLKIEGGDIYTTQLLPGTSATRFNYLQSGGTLHFDQTLTGVSDPNIKVSGSEMGFEMTGGEISISEYGGMHIDVPEGNYNIKGGTVNIVTSSSAFDLVSSIPLYNINITGSNTVSITNELTVINDLTVGSGTELDVSSYALNIGGDFTVDGTFTVVGNTTTFYGEGNSSISNGGTTTVLFYDLKLIKDAITDTVTITTGDFKVSNDLILNGGTLNTADETPSIKGNIEIIKGQIVNTGSGALLLDGSAQQTLKGAGGKEQEFGSIILNNSSADLSLLSDVNVSDFTFTSGMVNLDTHNLTVSGSLTGAGSSHFFYTTGAASDRGLTLGFSMSGIYSSGTIIATFPVGVSSTDYYPVVVKADGTTNATSGYLTVVPVDDYHPAVTSTSDAIDFYWKTKVEGFDNLSDDVVSMEFEYGATVSRWYREAFLEGQDWTWGDNGSGTTLVFNSNDDNFVNFIDGDFTAGKNSVFRRIDIFYSRQSGVDWFSGDAWLDENYIATSSTPGRGDIAVIRDGHRINVASGSSNIDIGILEFEHDTTVSTNLEDMPRLQIGTDNKVNIDRVKGTGIFTQWVDNVDDPEIYGDFGEFIDEKYSWFLFVASASSVNIPNQWTLYPNVMTEGDGCTLTFTEDITVLGDLNPRGNSTILMNSGVSGDIYVGGNLIIGDYNQGKLEFASTGIERTLTVEGNIDFTQSTSTPTNSRQINALNGTPSSLEHKIVLKGDIVQGVGVINLANTGTSANNVIIEFSGDNSATVTKTASEITDFYRIIIDKPEGEKVEFTGDFNLLGPTDGVTKALVLTSGECHLNNSGIDIDLSTGDNDFRIPEGTTLRVDNSVTVNVGGAASNTGIWLDGSLIVDNSGVVNCDQGSSGFTDNYISYSSSGSASIWLGSGAQLNVGSQIRRSLYSDVGILNFTQNVSTATVTVGINSAGDTSRGMFEIMGTSSFSQAADSKITIVRGNGADYTGLYFDPETVSAATGSGFVIGNASTPVSQTVAIYAGQPIMNLDVGSTNTPVASLRIVPLTIEENLTIGGEFDANGLDVIVNGDIACTGTYTHDNNTTYIEGETTQSISGNITFYNLIKQTGSSALTLNDNITVANNLSLETGSFNTGDYAASVQGNLTNDIGVSSNTGSQGIVLNGSYIQEISGSGSYDILSIDNGNGVVLPTQSGSLSFVDRLRMVDGVFDIGRNLLELQENAIIESVNPFSETNMVQTNLSFTDNGIKKYLPEIVSPSTLTFTYPIGSLGKYTPIVLEISKNGNNTGAIRVKAADEPHVTVPSAQQDSVLQYYWTLDATGVEGFSAEAKMYFYQADAIPESDTASYYTAKLLLGTTEWEKYTTDEFNGGTNNYLVFDIGGGVGTDDFGIDGDYTAGCAIPDDVPSYITVVDGDWTTTTVWAVYNPTTGTIGSPGVDVPAGGPRGSIVYVANNLTLSSNGMSAYRTVINATGSVITGSTFAHRFGDVSGTGSLVLESGDMPAGVYEEFLSINGGTLEFTGATTYDVLSDVTQVNNLKFSGSNTRNFPNIDVQLVGDLTVDGSNIVDLYDKTISIKGDINFKSGSFDSRSGKLLLNGDALQAIDGDVDFTATGGGELYDLEINSGHTVDVANDIEVKNSLVFVDGVFNTSAGGSLTITNSLNSSVVGGSDTSYVEGPLRKSITVSDYFVFPIGDALRYGEIRVDVDASSGGIWEAQYYNHNAGDDGMDPEIIDGSSSLAYVSHGEYWRVKAPVTGNSANLTMRWDSNSGVNPNGDFTLARWIDLTADAWSKVATGTVDETTGTTDLNSYLIFDEWSANHYITFGTISIPTFIWEGDDASSPTDWFTVGNWSGGALPDASADVTINNVTYDPVVSSFAAVQINNLTINSGATLTMDPGVQMTVNGDVTIDSNNGAVMAIKNSVDSPTSFLNLGSVTGDVTIEWTYPNGQYWYIGHSVDGATYSDYDTPTSNVFNLYGYSGGWSPITGSYGFDTNPLEGYVVKFAETTDVTVVNTGIIRNSNYTTSIDGWNLIANPYPSYINVTDAGFDIGNSLTTIWTTTNRTSVTQYATYNIDSDIGLLGGSKYIAPGQAFWLRNYFAGIFNIFTSTRVHAPSSLTQEELQLKGAMVSASNDVLRITLNDASAYDEVVIAFRDYGETDVITNYDSEKRLGNTTIPNVYAIKGGKKVAIGVYPEAGSVDTIHLGYEFSTEKMITLKATNLNEFSAIDNIYLFDKLAGVEVNLCETPEYTFMSTIGEDADRFEIYFTHVTTNIDNNIDGIAGEQIQIYGTGQKGIVKITEDVLAEAQGKGIIRLYSASGNMIKEINLTDVKTTINLPVNYGVYIIEVYAGDKIKTAKVTVVRSGVVGL